MIKLLIYFKLAFNQDFLTSAGNLVTSAKKIGSAMKCDTSNPDSLKVGNVFFSYFTTSLNTLYKTFPTLFAESYIPFRSFFICKMWSHIFNLAPLLLISRCI